MILRGANVDKVQNFWRWFELHENELFDIVSYDAHVLDLLRDELQKVRDGLTFELGSTAETRELVISADGDKNIFQQAISLVEASPNLRRWHFLALRPRGVFPVEITVGAKAADSTDVLFSLLDNGKVAGIRLFIPGYEVNDLAWREIGYLLLDHALGEYDVEQNLPLIKMYSPQEATVERRYPLIELPEKFDLLQRKLSGTKI